MLVDITKGKWENCFGIWDSVCLICFFVFWYWISNLWQSIECMANEVVFWTWSAETLNSLWCEMSICAKNLFNVGVCVNNSDDWLRLNYETSLRVFFTMYEVHMLLRERAKTRCLYLLLMIAGLFKALSLLNFLFINSCSNI